MNITSVTVGLTRTESLPGYSNIRPSLSLTAQIEPGEDWAYTRAQLADEVKAWIENYVDIELEKAGQPAKFSPDPRYTLIYWRQADTVHIIPRETKLDGLPGDWSVYKGVTDAIYAGHRLEALCSMIDKLGLPSYSEFDSANALLEWAYTYLDLPITWSIVLIHASVDDENWYFLGRAILPGPVYSALRVDDSFQTELHRSVGAVGFYDDVLKTVEDTSQTPTPIFRTLDEVGSWIQTRLLAVTAQESLDDPF